MKAKEIMPDVESKLFKIDTSAWSEITESLWLRKMDRIEGKKKNKEKQ